MLTDKNSYHSVEEQATTAEQASLVTGDKAHESPLMNKTRGSILLVLLSAAALLISAQSKPSQASMEMPLMGDPEVRLCTFDECFATNCNKQVAPFVCEFHNGGPHGGCSEYAWIEGTCDDQCNLAKCDSMVIPDTVDSCEGVECGADWCAGGQVCGPDVPYQCKSGSARFGCNADKLQWTLRTSDSVCSECCDATTCY